jgi:hypothetical protein
MTGTDDTRRASDRIEALEFQLAALQTRIGELEAYVPMLDRVAAFEAYTGAGVPEHLWDLESALLALTVPFRDVFSEAIAARLFAILDRGGRGGRSIQMSDGWFPLAMPLQRSKEEALPRTARELDEARQEWEWRELRADIIARRGEDIGPCPGLERRQAAAK